MRLIDADSIQWKGSTSGMCGYPDVRNAPTVEAIPIDWIIEWEKREENYYLYNHMVRFMIDDWRKEHETD